MPGRRCLHRINTTENKRERKDEKYPGLSPSPVLQPSNRASIWLNTARNQWTEQAGKCNLQELTPWIWDRAGDGRKRMDVQTGNDQHMNQAAQRPGWHWLVLLMWRMMRLSLGKRGQCRCCVWVCKRKSRHGLIPVFIKVLYRKPLWAF